MRFKKPVILLIVALLVIPVSDSAAYLKMEQIPTVFTELTKDKTLGNPSMMLLDVNSGETIFSRDANSFRKPASVLKLLSAFAALEFLPADRTFKTHIYKTDLSNTFQIVGDFDPSITPSLKLAKNLKFVWSDNLVNQIRKVAKSRTLKIRYYGLTFRTKANMNNYFRQVGYRITWVPISERESTFHVADQIYSATSPNLAEILHYTLLFSDNWVADYLAKSAAASAGYGYSNLGISMVFNDVLARYEINRAKVNAFDGSGLSHENRISTETLAQVLLKMINNPKFAPAINGLPVGGISGTLQRRFINSAPQAVGLVHAKTGSISGVVSLAGYIESGPHKYVFAIIADRIGRNYYAESAARAKIDKLLGKIAYPLEIATAPEITPTPSPETITS